MLQRSSRRLRLRPFSQDHRVNAARAAKQLAKSIMDSTGVRLVRQRRYDNLLQAEQAKTALGLLRQLPAEHVHRLIDLLPESKSQLQQDLFVLSRLDFRQGGYFVEFGATDGVTLSNSWLLEKRFDWSGIVAEPARTWHRQLLANRQCAIELDCVWTATGEELTFTEADWAEVSTIADFAGDDHHEASRKGGKSYKVRTVSLNDMLARHGAPAEMDYLSIDTEGSELAILAALDHDRYKFRVITCEHNFTPRREEIHALLTGHGYRRVLEEQSRYDDWYVRD